MISKLLTLREAAKLSSMSISTLRHSIMAGDLRSIQRVARGSHKIERAELLRWWASLGGSDIDIDDEETPR